MRREEKGEGKIHEEIFKTFLMGWKMTGKSKEAKHKTYT